MASNFTESGKSEVLNSFIKPACPVTVSATGGLVSRPKSATWPTPAQKPADAGSEAESVQKEGFSLPARRERPEKEKKTERRLCVRKRNWGLLLLRERVL